MPAALRQIKTRAAATPASEAQSVDYPLARSIGSQLKQTYRYFERELQHRLTPYDIQVGMWYFLRALWEEDGLSQRELSDRAASTPSATAEQLGKMEERGLIERRRSENDKRKILVYLTAEGQRLRPMLLPYAQGVNAVALEGMSEGEIGFLRIALARMKQNFTDHWTELGITTSINEPAKKR
jgi:MarR family transcriptional regulator, organic hydroperoxide resistance regulator